MRFLVDSGADVNAATLSDRATPLMRAAYAGHIDVIGILLDRGADPTLTDSRGRSALHKVRCIVSLYVFMTFVIFPSRPCHGVCIKMRIHSL